MKQIEFALRTKALELALAAANGHFEAVVLQPEESWPP